MKLIKIPLILTLFVFVGCAKVTSVESLALVDQYIAAWNSHNAAKAANFFDSNGTYFDATVGTPQAGRENIQKNVIEAFMLIAPDLQWVRDETVQAVVSQEGVAFSWLFSGTNKEKNHPFSIKGATLMRFKDGKIAYQGDYYDPSGL